MRLFFSLFYSRLLALEEAPQACKETVPDRQKAATAVKNVQAQLCQLSRYTCRPAASSPAAAKNCVPSDTFPKSPVSMKRSPIPKSSVKQSITERSCAENARQQFSFQSSAIRPTRKKPDANRKRDSRLLWSKSISVSPSCFSCG